MRHAPFGWFEFAMGMCVGGIVSLRVADPPLPDGQLLAHTIAAMAIVAMLVGIFRMARS